jgi:copper chaperone CopZ
MKTILRSSELSCPSCIAKIEKSLKSLDGVTQARVHFTTGRIEVEHDPARADTEQLVRAVRAVGYNAAVASR